MVREGTRSQTGNSRPRVFSSIDTEPTIKRTKPVGSRKKKTAAAPAAGAPAKNGAKPAGVTKKTPAKKTGSVAAKVCF